MGLVGQVTLERRDLFVELNVPVALGNDAPIS
jgi:hypothetical protein